MKNGYLKRIAAGVLVAAMAVTAVPAVSQIVNPTVTAQAAKKKKNAKVTNLGRQFSKGDGNGIFVGKTNVFASDFIMISNFKSGAKYSFTTNSKNLSIKLDKGSIKDLKEEYGKEWQSYAGSIIYSITAKKAGTYKVTIKEKYKGKTRTLKKNAKLYVYEPKAIDETTVYVGSEIYYSSLVSNDTFGTVNSEIVEDKGSILIEKGYDYDKDLKAVAVGQAKVRILDYYGNDCGIVTINTKMNHCTKLDPSDIAYQYDENNNEIVRVSISRYSDESAQESEVRVGSLYYAYGEDEEGVVSDPATVTSSDPSVVSVSHIDYDGVENPDEWYAAPQGTGDAILTVTCGGQSLQLPVHVDIRNNDYDD